MRSRIVGTGQKQRGVSGATKSYIVLISWVGQEIKIMFLIHLLGHVNVIIVCIDYVVRSNVGRTGFP